MIRTRIAPSPTGFPHIGTIYQALFDYSYAKKKGGKFILRIEDTDQARYVDGAEDKIFEALKWFGLNPDESTKNEGAFGPYKQSHRLDKYSHYAHDLIRNGHAYYCFCSKDRLDRVRKDMQEMGKIPMYDRFCRSLASDDIEKKLKSNESYVIRIKIPDNVTIKVQDLIRGEIQFDSNLLQDQVLLKADSYPTYHLAVVVDDHLMDISHVVRGEEWISTSPIHFLLYDYFGWDKPVFFHTPILRNPDKSKLSKRHGHTNISWYQQEGYLPEAILNFLSLMGWSHPEQKEIFTLDEFIGLFDLKDVKPVAPTFDLTKLDWMNGEYIRKMDNESLYHRITEYLKTNNDFSYPATLVEKTIPIIKERIKKLKDYIPLTSFFVEEIDNYEDNNFIADDGNKILLQKIYKQLDMISNEQWKAKWIETTLQHTAEIEANNINRSKFFMLLRIVITGKKISPPLNESIEILGKQKTLLRLSKVSNQSPVSINNANTANYQKIANI